METQGNSAAEEGINVNNVPTEGDAAAKLEGDVRRLMGSFMALLHNDIQRPIIEEILEKIAPGDKEYQSCVLSLACSRSEIGKYVRDVMEETTEL